MAQNEDNGPGFIVNSVIVMLAFALILGVGWLLSGDEREADQRRAGPIFVGQVNIAPQQVNIALLASEGDE